MAQLILKSIGSVVINNLFKKIIQKLIAISK